MSREHEGAAPSQKTSFDVWKMVPIGLSVAALVVSISSLYQSYLNRLYSEDTNRPVLSVQVVDSTFLPVRGWVAATTKVANVGRMTAEKVQEAAEGIRFSVNGFDDECFSVIGRSDTRNHPLTILPGASEQLTYIVGVTGDCLRDFAAAEPLPTIQVRTHLTYTDRAGVDGAQQVLFVIDRAQRATATPRGLNDKTRADAPAETAR